MKKIIIIGLLTITIFSLSGCGNKNEEAEVETEIISVQIDTSIPNITEMTKSEILNMTSKEVKESVETYLPSYKTIYKISDTKTLNDEEWIELRNIICTQFYGSATIETIIGTGEEGDEIYYAPKKETIEKMSTKEFGAYLNDLYTYLYGDEYLSKNNLNFEANDDTTLLNLKQNFIESIK